MYKNLSGDGLGVSCRQNELIELALTYGFKGVEVDISELLSRSDRFSSEFARRFIDSAKSAWNLCVGTFKLPVKLTESDADFAKTLEKVAKYAELAEALEAERCYIDLEPGSNDKPYHENFEQHRARVSNLADVLATKKVRLGLGINACPSAREGYEFEFVHQAEPLLTLIRSVGHPNVGIALDTWNWMVGSGALDQIQELKANEVVSVRLADVPAEADLATVKENDRLLPGQSETSIAGGVISFLKDSGYAGPVAVHPHSTQFSGVTRDNIVQQASSALGRIFEGAGVTVAVASASDNKDTKNPNAPLIDPAAKESESAEPATT